MNPNEPLSDAATPHGRTAASGKATTAVFTIISNNYSAHARVLMNSLAHHEPAWDRWVLLVDEPTEEPLIAPPCAQVKLATELPLPSPQTFFIRYDILEANTAVKPWMIDWLFGQGYSHVVYLDPDIKLYSPLIELREAMDDHSVVLTPHITKPYNDDKHPDELLIKRTGVFNLGFCAFQNDDEGRKIIKWWQGHLAENCVNSLARGIFVDQSWMNFCPVYCSRLHVLRHTGYNVAYWNLHYRQITGSKGDGFLRAGPTDALRFYHFSGFDYRHPGRLSRHQSRFGDADLSQELRQLLGEYANELISEGIEEVAQVSYKLGNPALPGPMVAPAFEDPCLKPVFHPENPAPDLDDWQGYLLAPDPRKPVLPIGLANIWYRRADIRTTFSLETPASVEAFCSWFESTGRREEKLPDDYPARGWWSNAGPVPVMTVNERPIITVYGYFEAVSGMGEAARSSVRALQRIGYPHRIVNFSVGNLSRKIRPPFNFNLPSVNGAIDLIHVNCDQTDVFLSRHPEVLLPGRFRIAYWAWEKEELPPSFYENAARFDEIWCLSEANARVFRQGTRQPVRVAWPNLEIGQVAPDAQVRTLLELPSDVQYFLALADFLSIPERKGPLDAIRAFKLAFPKPVDRVRLVAKSSNTSHRADYWARMLEAAGDRPDILLLNSSLDRPTLNGLIAHSLALVSLHAQEGFGLPIAEAIALGTSVICTGFGGNTDFCTEENSHLISYSKVTLTESIGPYRKGTDWAKPNVEEAASIMRSLVESPGKRFVERGPSIDPISGRSFEMYAENVGKLLEAWRAAKSAATAEKQDLILHNLAIDEFALSDGDIRLSGWANIDVPTMALVSATALIRNNGEAVTFPLARIRRPDVALHFKNAAQMESGFAGRFPVSKLRPGSYELEIQFVSPSGQATWNTGRNILI